MLGGSGFLFVREGFKLMKSLNRVDKQEPIIPVPMLFSVMFFSTWFSMGVIFLNPI